MAEGLARTIAGDRFEVASAGTEKTHVRPEAIEAMRKRGIDIRSHSSKTLDLFLEEPWDYVITVCDQANESCPFFPGGRHRLHWSFPDPSAATGTSSQRQRIFDETADAIATRIAEWMAMTPEAAPELG